MHAYLPYNMVLVHNQPASMQEMQEIKYKIKTLELRKFEKVWENLHTLF